jgi:serine/threonine-protein kinase
MGALGAEQTARVLGRYVLHGELASGGMATVHLARLLGEAGFSRTVAIKRLHPQFAKDPEFVAMFVDEARLAARIRHPNVVPTLDVVSEGGEIFLVMEYIHGESLSRLIRAVQTLKGRIDAPLAATIMAGVLHGLHAAHEARSEKGEPLGIVHRDVSPQNILVGVDGVAHVLDFGVAKATGRVQTTKEGQLKGKIAYMAPEQLDGGQLTRQSDIYAAAVVLWEMLALRRLFDGENEATVLVRIIEGKVPRPSSISPHVPPALDHIVLRSLDRDPSKRFASAREFAVALERAVPLVSSSDIGEWVQRMASDELARRARKLSEIERGSVRLLAATELKSEPPPARVEPLVGDSQSRIRLEPGGVAEPRSQVSTISVSKSEHSNIVLPPRRSSRGWVIAGVLALLLGVVFGFAFTRGGASPPVTAGPRPPVSPEPAAAPTVASTPTTAMAGPDSRPDSPSPANTGTAGIVDDPPPAPPSPAPARAPRLPKPRATNECDPPFTRDAQGHKHYKLQCL